MKKLFFLTILLILTPALIWLFGHSDQPAQLDNYTLPKELVFNDQIIPLNWTDNNDNEDLIIQSDRKYYHGHNSSIVYFSITNISNQDQETEINFLFDNNDNRGVKSITKIAQQDRTAFYRAIIYYPENSQGEFFIEAKGDKGGYGYLDPYYAGGLVGYWSFNGDDMDWSSTTAEVLDKSGQGNNGDATNDPQSAFGKVGQGLQFDGTDDYVDCGNDSSLAITNAITIGMWLKPASVGVWHRMLDKETSGNDGYVIAFRYSDGRVVFRFNRNNPIGTEYISANTLNLDEWNYFVATWDGTTMKSYFDGVQDSNTLTYTGTIGTNTQNLFIGRYVDAGSYYFDGLIDEVRVYNRALSAEEVMDLYRADAGRAKVNSPLVNTGSDSGLVGNWTFNGGDMDWSSSTAEVLDRSGQGNNGDVTNDPKPAFGISGQALEFDGTDDYVDCGNINLTTTQATVAFWIKLDSYSGLSTSDNLAPIIIDWMKGGAADWRDGTILCYIKTNPTWSGGSYATNGAICTYSSGDTTLNDVGTDTAISLNQWYQVVYTVNGTDARFYLDGSLANSVTGAGNISPENEIFAINNRDWNFGVTMDGLIDEVRIYNRALSAEEVMDLYRLGARRLGVNTSLKNTMTGGLVGHWTFNGQDMDWSSSTAEVLDRSGQGNNGDATNDPKPAFGISGQALEFDGSDDYVSVTDNGALDLGSSAVSVSVWVKINDLSTNAYIIGAAREIAVQHYTNNTVWCYFGSNADYVTTVNKITDNNWHFITCTRDSSGFSIYFDGDDVTTGSLGEATEDINVVDFTMGFDTTDGVYFDGTIDEVRIYNRALSAEEIQNLYQAGAGRFKMK